MEIKYNENRAEKELARLEYKQENCEHQFDRNSCGNCFHSNSYCIKCELEQCNFDKLVKDEFNGAIEKIKEWAKLDGNSAILYEDLVGYLNKIKK